MQHIRQGTAEANPNGSLDNIAGMLNEGRNVLGMMPHPDRSSESLLGSADGFHIFQSMIAQLGIAALSGHPPVRNSMIDIHHHLLPGLDDGAQTLDISLAMVEMAIADGITHIACTPHASHHYFFDPEHNATLFAELQDAVNQKVRRPGSRWAWAATST